MNMNKVDNPNVKHQYVQQMHMNQKLRNETFQGNMSSGQL